MPFMDSRHALRGILKDVRVTVLVITCLALGIGINATLFAVVDGVLIQPLPFVEPDRLVQLHETFERGGVRQAAVSYQNLRDWKASLTSFAGIAGTTSRSLAIADAGGEPERVAGGLISWDLFGILGVPPALGRPFGPEDDRPGAEPVIILGDALWQRRYQGDRAIIGRSIQVNGRPHTVVGVMPPQFAFPENNRAWIPLGPIADQEPRSIRNLFAIARLRPGVEIAAARTELAGVAATIAREHAGTNEGWSAAAFWVPEEFVPDEVRLILWTMMGAVTLVLMIACANVANLMLARASMRQREFSVRAALGAGRGRLVRQLLTECVMLGLLSAPLGLVIAYVGVVLLRNAMPPDDVPYFVQWAIDHRVIIYTTVVSALTGIVFGLAPALHAGRLSLVDALRDGSRGSGTSGRKARVRNALVVVEVALALVLLVGASLFVRSFMNLQGASPGFDTAPLLTMRFFMSGDAYRDDLPKTQRVEDIVARVEALPGVEAAFASNFIPLDAGGGGGSVVVEGRTVAAGEEPGIGFIAVTPHLFRTLGLSMLRGRDFTDAEGVSRSLVAVIDNTMATRIWPGEDPVGRRFRLEEGTPGEWFTVIGVAPDVRHDDLDDDSPPFPNAYVPYPYGPTPNTGLTIRASGESSALTSAVRAAIRASDRGLPIFNARTMEDLRRLGFWQYRLFGIMFAVFGGVALLLAAIGVYGVLSFAVAQRTQEIGLRIALGAERADVLRMVVRQGVLLAGVGVALGLIGAFGVTRVVATLLYNLTPTDPVSFGGVALFLLVVAWVASYVPARRATAVDPIVALRIE
jgi:putative ABC transport system permease protein